MFILMITQNKNTSIIKKKSSIAFTMTLNLHFLLTNYPKMVALKIVIKIVAVIKVNRALRKLR